MEEQKCVASNFFVAMNEKIELLRKDGENFSLFNFKVFSVDSFQIGVIVHKKEKIFTLSFKYDLFFLENDEYQKIHGRPVFHQDEMISYLIVLANNGQIPRKLIMQGYERRRMQHLESVIPT